MEINEYNCAVKHFLTNDVSIYSLIKKYDPIYLQQKRNYFVLLCVSIIGQQLSVSSARAIINKFLTYFNNKPTRISMLNTSTSTLRSLGLSNAKARYVKDLAEKLQNKEISFNRISKKTDTQILTELTKVKGIGPWTVHMFLIFVLGRKDVLPSGDLGIKKAIMLNYGLKNLPNDKEVIKISEKNNWSPYNSYASLVLWKSIDGE